MPIKKTFNIFCISFDSYTMWKFSIYMFQMNWKGKLRFWRQKRLASETKSHFVMWDAIEWYHHSILYSKNLVWMKPIFVGCVRLIQLQMNFSEISSEALTHIVIKNHSTQCDEKTAMTFFVVLKKYKKGMV